MIRISRGHYCPKEHQQHHLELASFYPKISVAYTQIALSVPDPNHISSFMNFCVADIQACYELWKNRGAEFITEQIPKYGEIRYYIRDPDGYIIEVGQSTELKYG
jgi:catechol 2,3-dioxygenase-like lactoylglutathione lyase family enzyme